MHAKHVYNNVYEAQMCTSFYYLISVVLISVSVLLIHLPVVLIIVPVVLISAQDDGTVEVLRRMNYLIQEGP